MDAQLDKLLAILRPAPAGDAVERAVKVLKQDDVRQDVLGIVLEPGVEDAHGDVITTVADVEDAAHGFMVALQNGEAAVGEDHTRAADAFVVESFVTPVDMDVNGQAVRAGTWLLKVHVADPLLWRSLVEGDRTGFSIGALGIREPMPE